MKLSTNIRIWTKLCSVARSVAPAASRLYWGRFSKYFGNEEEGRKAGRGIWGEAARALIVATPTPGSPPQIIVPHSPTNTPHLCPHKSHHLCISQIPCQISDKYLAFLLQDNTKIIESLYIPTKNIYTTKRNVLVTRASSRGKRWATP